MCLFLLSRISYDMNNIYVIGGDKRFDYLTQLLRADGYHAVEYLRRGEASQNCSLSIHGGAVVLPYPLSKEVGVLYAPLYPESVPLDRLFSRFAGASLILAGGEPPFVEGARCVNYALDEPFLQRNARLTAEGAFGLLLAVSDTAVCESRVVVTGFGRVAREVSALFRAAGAKIVIAARSQNDRSEAASLGYSSCGIGELSAASFTATAVINTVPAPIAKPADICSQIYIELASPPYGCSIEGLKELGVAAVVGGSLPAKTSPLSAARAVYTAIKKYL